MTRRITLAVVAILASTSISFACGTERWPVKVGLDRDASKVNTTAEETTIAALHELQAPPNPKSRNSSRFPNELKTFKISGILTVIKQEADEDYHLVIADPNDEEATMIVESPNPDCAKDSPFAARISDVRDTIDEKFPSLSRKKNPKIPVTVIGVAFFDPIHGQEGVAPNGIELHPILSITFQ